MCDSDVMTVFRVSEYGWHKLPDLTSSVPKLSVNCVVAVAQTLHMFSSEESEDI